MAGQTGQDALETFDRGVIETDEGFYNTLFRLHEVRREGVLPAIVLAYDRGTHMAKVKPLVKFVKETASGDVGFDRPEYEEIPVMQFCHGGFVVDAPIMPGDTGLLVSVDREWRTAREKNSAVLKPGDDGKANEGAQIPDSKDLSSFEWGVFIPMNWGATGLKDEDGLVFRRMAGAALDDIGDVELCLNDAGARIRRFKEVLLGEGLKSQMSSTVQVGDDAIQLQRKAKVIEDEQVKNRSEDAVTIAAEGILYDGTPDEEYGLVTDIRYDEETREIKKRRRPHSRRGDFIVKIGEDEEWETVGTFDSGLAIKEIKTEESTEPGGISTLTVILTDDTEYVLRSRNGTNGSDGYSPTAVVEKVGDTATITITDKDGTTTATMSDGPDGKDATVEITTSPAPPDQEGRSGTEVTLVAKSGGVPTGSKTFTVRDGKDGSGVTLDKEFQLDGVKQADIAASRNINIFQKTIAAGTGITVTEANNVITIAATGGGASTSGFTGTRYTLKDFRYDLSTHKLQMQRYVETWVDGVMTASVDPGSVWEDISGEAQAVQETV